MKRAAPPDRAAGAAPRVQPGADHAALALREAAALMAPIALWLLRMGVSYPAFAELLKAVFVEAARGELVRGATRPTQSALSLLSGVHRKDVRALAQAPVAAHGARRPPLASLVFTRWLSERRYRRADGSPRPLPRTGARRSFETLCREVSHDVHPRSLLDELLRLGLVTLDGERVVVAAASFVPSERVDELTALFVANAADHLAAAVGNVTLAGPTFLEQSIYADGLTPASVEVIHAVARRAWAAAFDRVVGTARERVELDNASDGERRVRFGVYFYSEAAIAGAAAPPTTGPAAKRRARHTDRP